MSKIKWLHPGIKKQMDNVDSSAYNNLTYEKLEEFIKNMLASIEITSDNEL